MRPGQLAEHVLIGKPTPKGQSKKHSALEVGMNYLSGFGIAWAAWHWGAVPLMAFLDAHDIHEPTVGFIITMFFTVISVIRSYIWRRIFNAL